MTNRIEIPISKTKSALPILFLLILGVSGVFAFLSPESFVSNVSKYNNPDSIRTIGIAAAGISLVLAIVFIRKLFTKKMGFTIDKSGITDISNASYTGLVEWNDITKVEGKKVGPIKLIILHTDNPEKYINKAKKTSIRQMRKNLSFYGSPLLIVSSRLKIKYDDLVVLITNEFEKSKRTTTQNKTH